ncbi:MAG: alpha/beta hydrolase, partial [Deltaproteobacteria bacterium]
SSARHPGVVLLQGSSANGRNDYVFIADHFARAGFAALAFDKRGFGESTGNYGTATYDDLAQDAAAAVERLRREPGVDSLRVGLWGLSQGGLLAPLVAARVPSRRTPSRRESRIIMSGLESVARSVSRSAKK